MVPTETFDRMTPARSALLADQVRFWAIVILVGVALLALLLLKFSPNRPVVRDNPRDQFMYGSIGSDTGALPTKVLLVMPEICASHLPADAPRDLTAFGFIQQPGERLPIGFSVRRQLIDRSSINCASCHTGQVREAPGAPPRVILGMPANRLDILGFYRFLFDCAGDPAFTADRVLAALEARGWRQALDGPIYRYAVPQMRKALLARRDRTAFLFAPGYTPFLPGRVDTFDTFKVDQFRAYYAAHQPRLDPDEMFGIVAFPSIWNQRPREGLNLHWDGNQTSVRERNFSAAIGAGATPEAMDIPTLFGIEAWLKDLAPPRYPFPVDQALAAQGEEIYRGRCASCHDFGQPGVGQVYKLDDIGTDPYRLRSYTETVRLAQIDYTKGQFWQFRHFRVSDGYASPPLDGIWARAPYLHNASVPSMWDLLSPEAARPAAFEVGIDVYDQQRMGYAAERLVPAGDGFATLGGAPYRGRAQVLDTRLRGNSAAGHTGGRYGTDLDDARKRALIEYLKTK